MQNEKSMSDVQETPAPETSEDVQQEVELKKESELDDSKKEQEPAAEKAVNGVEVVPEAIVEEQNTEDKSTDEDAKSTDSEVNAATIPDEKPILAEDEDSESEKSAEKPSTESKEEPIVEESSGTKSSESTAESSEEVVENQSDAEAHEAADDQEEVDFEVLDKEGLVEELIKLKDVVNIRSMDRMLKAAKSRYDDILSEEKALALKEFLSVEGNVEEDFDFKGDDKDTRFFEHYNFLRNKRNQFFKEQEKSKEENLKIKNQILEDIRQLVDGEESDISLNKIRELQDLWKNTGPVAGMQNKTLWATYNALLDRFYDARSIYFELKDLDRKKNLTAKQALCERAEVLDGLENIQEAVATLNELHEEYKHIGPVPNEEREALWTRFKAASDKIYVKRRSYVDDLKKDLQENLKKKKEIIAEMSEYKDFNSEKVSEWHQKTKSILDLQNRWNAIGGMPREKAREVNKEFWSAFKSYFSVKNSFFKKIEGERDQNLKLKMGLVEQVEQLKVSKEWDKVAGQMKKLQQDWRDIGPVPDAMRNEVYKQFKSACDYFFEQKRAEFSHQNDEFEKNYASKVASCEEIEKILESDKVDVEKILANIDVFMQAGFVPRKVIKKIQRRLDDTIDKIIKSDKLSDAEKDEFKLNLEFTKAGGGKKGGGQNARKESVLRRQISTLEHDINTYKTNIDFFASSKNADILKNELNEKISGAVDQLESLKKELRQLKS